MARSWLRIRARWKLYRAMKEPDIFDWLWMLTGRSF